MPEILFDSDIKSLPLVGRGKVRDIYGVGEDRLLIVTTDRLSAFDVVLPTAIPGKGAVLTAVSNFWFERTRDLIPNHLSDLALEAVLPDAAERAQVEGRAVVVRRLDPLPVEAIVRGYLVGSGWKDYQRSQSVCGIPLPAGLRQADKLPEPLFTPSTKAELGNHDELTSRDALIASGQISAEHYDTAAAIGAALFAEGCRWAESRGLILVDTKYEMGLDADV